MQSLRRVLMQLLGTHLLTHMHPVGAKYFSAKHSY